MEAVGKKLDSVIEKYIDAVNRFTESILKSAMRVATRDKIKIVDKDWWQIEILFHRTILVDNEWFGEIVAQIDGEKITVTGRHQNAA